MKKRLICLALALIMVFSLLPVGALAAEVVSSGYCGLYNSTNVTWSLNSNGVLTISGTGAMENYSTDILSFAPWHYSRDSIKSVVIHYGVTSIGDWTFWGCSSLTSITIPNSVTSIGSGAFNSCDSLTSVTIPNSVTSIGDEAFFVCSSLTSVSIPNSVTSIGDEAFRGCSSLPSIKIPDSVTLVGLLAFKNCSSLKSVYISDIVAWCTTDFVGSTANPLCNGAKLYCNNELVTTLVIPDSMTIIGNYVFSGYDILTSVTIPDSVTSIGNGAFYGCSSLTSINIPDGVTSIGNSAFEDCESLTSINIPDGVTSIGDYAFYGCSSLPSITIPDSVTNIGDAAFEDCSSLTSITIPDSVTSIGGGAFRWCSSLTSVTIPNSVTSIGENAFEYCRSLTSVTIGNGVTSIGDSTFSFCSSLTSVTIPDGVTSIGDYAFKGCSSLTSVTIGNGVTSIGYDAFRDCSSLTSVYISDIAAWCNINFSGISSNPLYYNASLYLNNELVTDLVIPDSVTSIGDWTFWGCSSLTSITIPDSVTSIGDYAFKGCSNLPSITIPDSVTSIGDSTFKGCSSLPSVTIPDSVTSIGDDAFYDCESLTSVTIGNGVTSIGDSTFSWCSSLTSINIPDGVTSIGNSAFSGCESLTSISIPNSVTSIGNSAFEDCESLTSISIPNKVTSIGKWTFYGCSSLASVTIPDGVTSIGDHAFYGCSSLASVTIPDSVTSIGDYAFWVCSSLTSITIPDSVTSIGDYAFCGCDSLTGIWVDEANENYSCDEYGVLFNKGKSELICCPSGYEGAYTIPGSVINIISDAFYDCESLTSITISDSVTSIGNGAFHGCSSLPSITIPDSVTSIGDYAFWVCSSLTRVAIGNDVTSIGRYAFSGCSSLTDVYYAGTEAQRGEISIGRYNDPLINATWHYNSIMPDIVLNGDKETVYFVPLKTDKISKNDCGDWFLPTKVIDGTGEPVAGADVYGTDYYDGNAYGTKFEKLTTDKNGIVVLPLYGEGENKISISVVRLPGHSYKLGNQSISAETVRSPLSLEEEYSGTVTTELSFSPLDSLSGGGSAASDIKAKFAHNGSDCTLSLSKALIFGAKADLSGSANMDSEILSADIAGGSGENIKGVENVLKIEHFDESNDAHIAAVGYFLLGCMFQNSSATSMLLDKEYIRQKLGDVSSLYGTQEAKVEIEVGPGGDVSVGLGTVSFKLGRDNDTTKYTMSEKYDSALDEYSYSSEVQVKNGLVVSGTWIPELPISSSIYGVDLNQKTSEVVVTKDGSKQLKSVSLNTSDEVYDDVIGTSVSKSNSSEVNFTGNNAQELLKDEAVSRLASGKGVVFTNKNGDYLADTVNAMYELEDPADIVYKEKLKDSYKYEMKFDLNEIVEASVGFSGSLSSEYQVATGIIYKGEKYDTTDGRGSHYTHEFNTEAPHKSLGDVLEISAKGVFEFLKNAIVSKVGNAVNGVINKTAEAIGSIEDWFIKLTTVDDSSKMARRASRTTESSTSIAIVDGKQIGIKIVSTPYILDVFTDESCQTAVESSALANNPVSLTIAAEGIASLENVEMYRFDNEAGAYVPVEGAVKNDTDLSMTGKVGVTGEFVLAVHEHSYNAVVTAPTCTEKGYTTHTCACGDSYKDSYVNALGHSYKDGVCDVCGAKDPDYKPPVVKENPFVDVSEGSVYYDAILWAYYHEPQQITGGYTATEFRPGNPCTRGQVVTFLWRAAGCPEPTGDINVFNDASSIAAPYRKAVAWAVEKGITTGFADGTFRPNDSVTRAQFVTFLWRYENKPATTGSIAGFTDAASIAAPYQQAVAWAVEKGVTTGYNDGSFRPNDTCTRWAVVLFMYRDMA